MFNDFDINDYCNIYVVDDTKFKSLKRTYGDDDDYGSYVEVGSSVVVGGSSKESGAVPVVNKLLGKGAFYEVYDILSLRKN